jgi:phosphopentomutase
MNEVPRRVLILVLDSVGIGELPDAGLYGDEGSDTLGHLAEAVGGFNLPNLEALGLGNIKPLAGMRPQGSPLAFYGKMGEASKGKDTTTGHWEMAGSISERAFPTYPSGFPQEIIGAFGQATGRPIIGNYPASGTEIIKDLGEEHMRTGALIVYTSADSVFQIAAHEEIVPVEELYRYCEIARSMLHGEHGVGRVIARPFIGSPGSFKRTDRRHDFSLPPPIDTVLDAAAKGGLSVRGIGKIKDIFAGKGITDSRHSHNNRDGIGIFIEEIGKSWGSGILFINLVDFDMLFGHRNDTAGYYAALQEVDSFLPAILEAMKAGDLLIITADHGCDPTTASTDHSREYVPLLVYGKWMGKGESLGTRETFSDIANTAAEYLGLEARFPGESFLGALGHRS